MGFAKYAEDNWEIYNERMASRDWFSTEYGSYNRYKQNSRTEDKKDGDKNLSKK